MVLVPDANTLIYLAKADLLDTLGGEGQVWVGDEVYREAVERGKEEGYGDAFLLERYLRDHAVRRSLGEEREGRQGSGRFEEELAYFGGPGETEAFLLAERSADGTVVTSDHVAFKKLKRRGARVVRTDMLVYRRFQQGKISRRELYDRLAALREVHATTDQRIAFLMEKAEAAGHRASEAEAEAKAEAGEVDR